MLFLNYTLTKIVKIRRRSGADPGVFDGGVYYTNRPTNYTLIYFKLSYVCPKTWRIRKDSRDFKIRDATAVRRDRKKIFKEETCCACSRSRPGVTTSRRERGFHEFDVLYKT